MHSFMKAHSFAMLVGNANGQPEVSHLPLLLQVDEDTAKLLGHFARANDHHKHLHDQSVAAVFRGPHAYISPSWYEETNVVPTWNYLTVHAYGTLRIVEDPKAVLEILRKTVETYEADFEQPWSIDQPDELFIAQLATAVVAFEIEIQRLEGKWKLSQNHSAQRRQRVARELRKRGTENANAIADFMSPESC